MLSFQPLTPDGIPHAPDPDTEEYLEDLARGGDCAFAEDGAFLYLRFYDGGDYAFAYPIEREKTDGGQKDAALIALQSYCTKEEIPLLLTDVPEEERERVTSLFPHAQICPAGDGSLFVRVQNELSALKKIPVLKAGRITLSPIIRRDAAAYADLCREEETLRYWGYDYREDYPEGVEDAFFYACARREWEARTALTYAIRQDGKLVGECGLYAFDARGSAESLIRIAPQYRRRGIAAAAWDLLCTFAFGTLGLAEVRASVHRENLPSLSFFAPRATRVPERDTDRAVAFSTCGNADRTV